jgi:hypothetical protein
MIWIIIAIILVKLVLLCFLWKYRAKITILLWDVKDKIRENKYEIMDLLAFLSVSAVVFIVVYYSGRAVWRLIQECLLWYGA